MFPLFLEEPSAQPGSPTPRCDMVLRYPIYHVRLGARCFSSSGQHPQPDFVAADPAKKLRLPAQKTRCFRGPTKGLRRAASSCLSKQPGERPLTARPDGPCAQEKSAAVSAGIVVLLDPAAGLAKIKLNRRARKKSPMPVQHNSRRNTAAAFGSDHGTRLTTRTTVSGKYKFAEGERPRPVLNAPMILSLLSPVKPRNLPEKKLLTAVLDGKSKTHDSDSPLCFFSESKLVIRKKLRRKSKLKTHCASRAGEHDPPQAFRSLNEDLDCLL